MTRGLHPAAGSVGDRVRATQPVRRGRHQHRCPALPDRLPDHPGPYRYRNNPIARYEGHSFSQVYASVFYSHFAALGLAVTVEDASHHGRVGMTVDFGGISTCSNSRWWSSSRPEAMPTSTAAPASRIHLIGVEFSRRSGRSWRSRWKVPSELPWKCSLPRERSLLRERWCYAGPALPQSPWPSRPGGSPPLTK